MRLNKPNQKKYEYLCTTICKLSSVDFFPLDLQSCYLYHRLRVLYLVIFVSDWECFTKFNKLTKISKRINWLNLQNDFTKMLFLFGFKAKDQILQFELHCNDFKPVLFHQFVLAVHWFAMLTWGVIITWGESLFSSLLWLGVS